MKERGTITGHGLHVQPRRVTVEDAHLNLGGTPVLRGVSLTIEPGASVALLGPSGCGKTTLLRLIAGLERPDGGIVRLDDEVLNGGERFVEPEQRRVGMVFQDGALFPHLTVAENVAFGLHKTADRDDRIGAALDLVGLGALAGRLPAHLSGGERQRVALARALAPEPAVLLLDEPFARLDATLRVQLRTEVRRLLSELGITSLFVTHDQDEAFVLGDEIAVMQAGRILQSGTPGELYERPSDRWVATFVGDANLFPGEASAGQAATDVGQVPLVAGLNDASSGSVDVLLRPEFLELESDGAWTVETVEFYGHDSMYQLTRDDGHRLQVRSFTAPHHRRGERVSVRYVGPPTVAYSIH
jgi:iron(III) transport system ATP-binding protein